LFLLFFSAPTYVNNVILNNELKYSFVFPTSLRRFDAAKVWRLFGLRKVYVKNLRSNAALLTKVKKKAILDIFIHSVAQNNEKGPQLTLLQPFMIIKLIYLNSLSGLY